MTTIVAGSEPEQYYHFHQRIAVVSCISFSLIGLLLLCVGVGTPSWHTEFSDLGITPSWYTNYFYTCSAPNGTCYNNQNLVSSGIVNSTNQPITGIAVSTDYYLRLRNAGALAIVGILFLSFAISGTIILLIPTLHFHILDGRFNLIGAFLFGLAALFQRAGLSEGQHVMSYNGYSANLYQTGHALTIICIPICAAIAGRMPFVKRKIIQ